MGSFLFNNISHLVFNCLPVFFLLIFDKWLARADISTYWRENVLCGSNWGPILNGMILSLNAEGNLTYHGIYYINFIYDNFPFSGSFDGMCGKSSGIVKSSRDKNGVPFFRDYSYECDFLFILFLPFSINKSNWFVFYAVAKCRWLYVFKHVRLFEYMFRKINVHMSGFFVSQ